METDLFYWIIFITALFAAVYFLIVGVSKSTDLSWKGRVAYILLSIPIFYDAIIYALVISGLFPSVGYGLYLRPAVPGVIINGVIVDFMLRPRRRKAKWNLKI